MIFVPRDKFSFNILVLDGSDCSRKRYGVPIPIPLQSRRMARLLFPIKSSVKIFHALNWFDKRLILGLVGQIMSNVYLFRGLEGLHYLLEDHMLTELMDKDVN